jgi:hypothetical protein
VTVQLTEATEVTADAVREAAYRWHAAGFSVLPVVETGEKRPDVDRWTHYQREQPTAQQLGQWYNGTGRTGLGVVTGAISGNVEMFELEGRAVTEGARERIIPALKAAGVHDVWRKLVNGYVDISPTGGPHFIYRLEDHEVPKNTKVASRPKRAEELTEADRALLAKYPQKVIPFVLAETRGEGGFTVVAPSHGTTHPSGRAWEISNKSQPGRVVTITWDERVALFAAISAVLDEMPTPEPIAPRTPHQPTSDGSERPGDAYSRQTSWNDVLQPHGWTLIYRRGDMDYWRRPGDDKKIGWSARTGGTHDGLWVWSSSTVFPTEVSMTKFRAYSILVHGGDERNAAAQLRKDGYGGSRTSTNPQPAKADAGMAGGVGDDADALNGMVVRLTKVRNIIDQHIGRNPSVPSPQVIGEIYDHLYEVANPTGVVGKAAAGGVVDYPTQWLPKAMLEQLEMRGALHPAGIGAAMFGCASAACLAVRLVVDGSRTVLPTLWIPSIGYAGSGKSPAAELVFQPYRDREEAVIAKYITERITWQNAGRDERKTMVRPYNDARLLTDITAEALVRRLEGTLEGAAFVPDELSAFLLGFGSYKKGDGQGADKSRLLELWSGRPWAYDRVGTGDNEIFIYIRQPVVPIFGTIQPEFVRLLGDVGSGMQARWLPHFVGRREGEETGRTSPLWASVIGRLLSCLHSKREWTLTEGSEARELHRAAERRWAAEGASVEQTAASSSFLEKAGEHCLRVALVAAEVDAATEALSHGGLIRSGELPAWTVRAGIDFVDYCARVWLALGTTESSLALSYAERAIAEKDDRLNAWLHGREGKSATVYEIRRAKVAGCRTKEQVQALVDRHKAIHGDESVVVERANGFRVFAR